jgi:hypothetical protein
LFLEGEAVESGAMESHEIRVIGFVIGICNLSELFSGERVDDANIEAGLAKCHLDRAMVSSGAFECDNKIVNLSQLCSLIDECDSGL